MRINRYIQNIIGILLCAVFCVICFSDTALAQGPIDINKNVTLTIKYPYKDVQFQIFKVADVSTYGEYTLTDDFKKYSVPLKPSEQDDWRAAAYTLSGYVRRDNLVCQQAVNSNSQGKIIFSNVSPGLYLIIGESIVLNNMKYEPSPFLLILPALDESGNWVTDVTVTAKYSSDSVGTSGGKTLDRKVLKIWEKDDRSQRPKYVDVQLLRNGKIWDSVRLSKKNNWRYEWENLDAQYTWKVVEKTVPDGYSVIIELDKKTYVITNTKNSTPSTPEQPDKPSVPGPTVQKPQSKPMLPQTGVLWWPVGILGISGTLMLLFGFIRRKQNHE